MNKCKINILLLLTCFTISLHGQEYNSAHEKLEWVQKLSEYRSYFLRKNVDATNELKTLSDKWDSLNISEDQRVELTLNVQAFSGVYQESYRKAKKRVKKSFPKSELVASLTKDDFNIIIRNGELLNLIHIGLLKPSYPFMINPETTLFDEFDFYEIEETDSIGEIGGGTGTFGLLLHTIKPQNKLYINEINVRYLQYIDAVIKNNRSLFTNNNIGLFEGSDVSTYLESYDLDKIIIRNTFHHFSHVGEMLESIKKSLDPTGYLYISESIKVLGREEEFCKKALLRDEIINPIIEKGFYLEEELELVDTTIFKFSIVKQ